MSEQQHQHHHHHHHKHRSDWATDFKRKSMNSILRQKKIEKWLLRILIAVAVIMAIAVIVVYKLD